MNNLFEFQAEKAPGLVALKFDDALITYAELNRRANILASAILIHSATAEVIGISTTRGVEMIIGLLAILKAGKAYLPIDPRYPVNRLQQIIEDSEAETCLCYENEFPVFQSLGLATLDFNSVFLSAQRPQFSRQPELAYVLFTSGSTGRPKGVGMGHRALVNLINWQQKNSCAGQGTVTLQFSPLSFDVSFQEIFATLTTGGTLVLIEETMLLEPVLLLKYIVANQINRIFLPFIALKYLTEAADSALLFPQSLQEVITAGEQLKITPQIKKFFTVLPGATLYNQYGPTECHVVTQLKLDGNPESWPALPSVGHPIDNTQIYIVDTDLKVVPEGVEGELCIGGVCLAEGYINHPELTDEKFLVWQSPYEELVRIYRTGDIARYLPGGDIEFLGREDDQVKISGYRIELGEIEVVLSAQAGISHAVVIAVGAGNKRLAAYVVSADGKEDTVALRKTLEDVLPYYMLPSVFIWLREMPRTATGKVDKKSLPKPALKRPALSVLYKSPSGKVEQQLAGVWETMLQIDKAGTDDNFFESGGTSLLAVRFITELKLQYEYQLTTSKLYQYPTIKGLADHLVGIELKTSEINYTSVRDNCERDAVAVIGMAGRFPGANTVEELWEILKEGKETVSFFTKEELDPYIPKEVVDNPDYVMARGIIENADEFDADFFGINPRLAELMDPQQRVFLEIAWEVLESTGYAVSAANRRVGVFAGSGNNSYYLNNVHGNNERIDKAGGFQVMTYNEKDYIATRTAYALNLKGPAVSVHSGCSTSLLAVAQAVESIRNGQCEVAIAGGVAITSPVKSGHLYQEGAMFSDDGHTRPFDAEAKGTVFSDGAGVVLLKSLVAAMRDGDTIYGVIKGIGLNNDGGEKGVFTAPSAEGQAGAIIMALHDAGVDAGTLTYIEAHGTATPLGDPIETDGLAIAFGKQEKKQFCGIGSIKSNIGHLTAAAGVAGLIKTLLALHHKLLPASINYNAPNPEINFADSPFYVNTILKPWVANAIRRAGVSSFGVGGTNVHIILEEHEHIPQPVSGSRPVQLISWSAKNAVSRESYGERLADFLKDNKGADIADIACSLHSTRVNFDARRFVIAENSDGLVNTLTSPSVNPNNSNILSSVPAGVVFMFPGQGAQYVNMGLSLYLHEPVYKQALDECADFLLQELHEDIRKILFPGGATEEAKKKIDHTYFTQPAIFSTCYALAKLFMSWGVQPAAFIGHSIGEFVGAHLAGVFTLRDALHLIAERGRLMERLPRGSMLSVRAGVEILEPILPITISLAAINSEGLTVVAGSVTDIALFSKVLDEQGIGNKLLHTSHAFHSSMMDSIVSPFERIVKSVSLNSPDIPILSSVTGQWMNDEDAKSPAYWANHLRATVRFSDAVNTLLADDGYVLLEIGPGNVTTTLATQNSAQKQVVAISSLELAEDKTAHHTALKALGQLWLNGVQPDWKAFYAGQTRQRLNLPAYSFNRKRYWVDPATHSGAYMDTSAIDAPYFEAKGIEESQDIVEGFSESEAVLQVLRKVLHDASGIDISAIDQQAGFLEMGLDSLLLTQIAINVKKEFNVPVTFRQINEAYNSVEALHKHLLNNIPADKMHQIVNSNRPAPRITPGNDALGSIARQIQLLAQQVASLQGTGVAPSSLGYAAAPVNSAVNIEHNLTDEEVKELKKPFGALARIEKQSMELTSRQQEFITEFTKRYNEKTPKSKAYTGEHRAFMADPRVVSGFRPQTKEIVYPIIVNKSKGSRLWDIDGNEYIDALNGFGSNMFGNQPDFITDALKSQIEEGYEVGSQHPLAGAVSKLICEFTNFDRAALCNTGSEAVLGAMRIARTVTGRSLIVAFSGSYHGINDEVIVRGTGQLKSFPAAPGIMPEAVQNMLILEYGTDETLNIITQRAHELAAVLVEPVQSRRPEYQPVEFLKKLRTLTADKGIALIFDEVITGFRMHSGGAQAIFGIKADLGTYGKVIGGGMPIGAIAGISKYMDSLDGGNWHFGDASVPEAGVTYFAGTFVRHPLALAAANASLLHMKEKGEKLQISLTEKTTYLADAMNKICTNKNMPFFVPHFGSLWKIKFHDNNTPYGELLFSLMREKGIHIWDGFPCFITEAHTYDELNTIIRHFEASITELKAGGFYADSGAAPLQKETANGSSAESTPPVKGARLGRDKDGNPAWFISDPARPGKYMQVVKNKN
ncbi:MAG: amino acid adenylation domain-containing protein [Taibaiella sp.]|nr:amino acid adenylation domain-containing protein [Taibaiella sp.]